MKTKLIAFVLAGLMVLSLVGCGQQKDPTGDTNANNGGVTDNNAVHRIRFICFDLQVIPI